MKRSFLIISLLSLLCCACAGRKTIVPKFNLIDMPPCNQISTAEIGNSILNKGEQYTYDGIRLQSRIQTDKEDMIQIFTVEPGTLIAKVEDSEWIYYYAEEWHFKTSYHGQDTYTEGGIQVHKEQKEEDRIFRNRNFRASTPTEKPIYTRKKVTAINRPSFQQELIYNGRVGNSVKFLYRELSNDYMRPAFSQTVQYDLSKGNIFGFKGARFKIIEATNTYIKYEILKSFPDRL